MKSIMLCFLFILHFLHFPLTYIIRWQERISFVNTLPRRRKIGRIFLGPNIYGSFYSGHFLLELLKSALKSFPSSLHHLGLNWIFCRVHFSPVYACYELPCVSWEDRIKGNFSSGFIWRDKRIWGGATSSGRLSRANEPDKPIALGHASLLFPSATQQANSSKRHKCFTSGHFDQKAINPNQQEDRI